MHCNGSPRIGVVHTPMSSRPTVKTSPSPTLDSIFKRENLSPRPSSKSSCANVTMCTDTSRRFGERTVNQAVNASPEPNRSVSIFSELSSVSLLSRGETMYEPTLGPRFNTPMKSSCVPLYCIGVGRATVSVRTSIRPLVTACESNAIWGDDGGTLTSAR
jgi:hypothetical protein